MTEGKSSATSNHDTIHVIVPFLVPLHPKHTLMEVQMPRSQTNRLPVIGVVVEVAQTL